MLANTVLIKEIQLLELDWSLKSILVGDPVLLVPSLEWNWWQSTLRSECYIVESSATVIFVCEEHIIIAPTNQELPSSHSDQSAVRLMQDSFGFHMQIVTQQCLTHNFSVIRADAKSKLSGVFSYLRNSKLK